MDKQFDLLGHSVSISPIVSDGMQPTEAEGHQEGPIGKKQIAKAAETLQKYKEGKTNLEQRIIENEKWYKLRHWDVIRKKAVVGEIEPASAWLFNSIANKHADAMDNYPEPNILPRESGDEPDAKMLSSIIPVILQRNEFEETHSDGWWYKLKNGVVPYGVFWDSSKENGLGDIVVKKLDILNIFWTPGIINIQDSRNLFIVALMDKEDLMAQYPWINENATTTLTVAEYVHDETIDTSDKAVVVDWYYKVKQPSGKTLLHYVKFVGNELLYASENDPVYAESGYYSHGEYPIVFDVLFPEEDMPTGFGYVDVMREPQMYIDKLDQIIMTNALRSGKSRWFINDSGNVNEEEFSDWAKDFIHVAGGMDERSLREVVVKPLPAFIINHKQMKIDELKETSGNRDFSQGSTNSGVTAASAIAALQEAGNKLSRDVIKGGYRTYTKIVYLVIENCRQFYDEARSFRIVGEQGAIEYVQYNNARIKMRQLPAAYPGQEPAYKVPVFDIEVRPQKSNPFSKAAQNELAKELYGMGFFDPARADIALTALELMDFEGKTKITQRISQNGGMYQQLQQLMAIVTQLTGGVQQQEQAGNSKAAPSSGSKSMDAKTMQAATDNANQSYGERLAARAQPNVSRPSGVTA